MTPPPNNTTPRFFIRSLFLIFIEDKNIECLARSSERHTLLSCDVLKEMMTFFRCMATPMAAA